MVLLQWDVTAVRCLKRHQSELSIQQKVKLKKQNFSRRDTIFVAICFGLQLTVTPGVYCRFTGDESCVAYADACMHYLTRVLCNVSESGSQSMHYSCLKSHR